jgi:ubiquitin-conjugating enzyme E2 G1
MAEETKAVNDDLIPGIGWWLLNRTGLREDIGAAMRDPRSFRLGVSNDDPLRAPLIAPYWQGENADTCGSTQGFSLAYESAYRGAQRRPSSCPDPGAYISISGVTAIERYIVDRIGVNLQPWMISLELLENAKAVKLRSSEITCEFFDTHASVGWFHLGMSASLRRAYSDGRCVFRFPDDEPLFKEMPEITSHAQRGIGMIVFPPRFFMITVTGHPRHPFALFQRELLEYGKLVTFEPCDSTLPITFKARWRTNSLPTSGRIEFAGTEVSRTQAATKATTKAAKHLRIAAGQVVFVRGLPIGDSAPFDAQVAPREPRATPGVALCALCHLAAQAAAHPSGFYAAAPRDDDLFRWQLSIVTDSQGHYRGAVLPAELVFSDTYPREAPVLRFTSAMWHPNVAARDGTVCHPLFTTPSNSIDFAASRGVACERWLPIHALDLIVSAILVLLEEPGLENPVNAEAAAQARLDPETFWEKARSCVGL